jgi:hypothetical protein
MSTSRRALTPFPLEQAIAALTGAEPRARVMTMCEGQWDALLSAAYESGWTLLELDSEERPLRAYRLKKPETEGDTP